MAQQQQRLEKLALPRPPTGPLPAIPEPITLRGLERPITPSRYGQPLSTRRLSAAPTQFSTGTTTPDIAGNSRRTSSVYSQSSIGWEAPRSWEFETEENVLPAERKPNGSPLLVLPSTAYRRESRETSPNMNTAGSRHHVEASSRRCSSVLPEPDINERVLPISLQSPKLIRNSDFDALDWAVEHLAEIHSPILTPPPQRMEASRSPSDRGSGSIARSLSPRTTLSERSHSRSPFSRRSLEYAEHNIPIRGRLPERTATPPVKRSSNPQKLTSSTSPRKSPGGLSRSISRTHSPLSLPEFTYGEESEEEASKDEYHDSLVQQYKAQASLRIPNASPALPTPRKSLFPKPLHWSKGKQKAHQDKVKANRPADSVFSIHEYAEQRKGSSSGQISVSHLFSSPSGFPSLFPKPTSPQPLKYSGKMSNTGPPIQLQLPSPSTSRELSSKHIRPPFENNSMIRYRSHSEAYHPDEKQLQDASNESRPSIDKTSMTTSKTSTSLSRGSTVLPVANSIISASSEGAAAVSGLHPGARVDANLVEATLANPSAPKGKNLSSLKTRPKKQANDSNTIKKPSSTSSIPEDTASTFPPRLSIRSPTATKVKTTTTTTHRRSSSFSFTSSKTSSSSFSTSAPHRTTYYTHAIPLTSEGATLATSLYPTAKVEDVDLALAEAAICSAAAAAAISKKSKKAEKRGKDAALLRERRREELKRNIRHVVTVDPVGWMPPPPSSSLSLPPLPPPSRLLPLPPLPPPPPPPPKPHAGAMAKEKAKVAEQEVPVSEQQELVAVTRETRMSREEEMLLHGGAAGLGRRWV